MNLASFIFYCFIVTFTPGPTNIVILSTVHNRGVRKGMEYTYGATLAFGLLLACSAVLNTVLATVLPKVLIVMQVVGTFYMLYLAYQIYQMDASKDSVNQTGSFLTGFLMQFLNPKVVLFTMTVIPGFILPYYTDTIAVLLAVFAITIIGFVAFVTWVLFGAVFKTFLQRHNKPVNVVMSLFLVYATIMIWL
ncbi:LysE family translocator [Exiguobacterium chiriqhucha]|uniref:LysE family translocator n=1 Tax=Exiguobacterium chiriqhucha TaxID=1385984 RepID=UPI0038BDCFFA